MYGLNTFWSFQDIEKVRKLAEEGYSSGMIAVELRKTRNAIIGICARRGIKLKGASGIKTKKRFVQNPNNRWLEKDELNLSEKRHRIPMIDIRHGECRWMIGEPREGLCCGRPTTGGSYCLDHIRRIYKE